MSTITNKNNLPKPIYDFLSRDRYTPGDSEYSVTELLRSPRISILSRRHNSEIEEDAIDLVWSLLGNGVHKLLESESNTSEAETRYYTTCGGCKIGGQVDHYKDGIITDYKVTSTWNLIYKSSFEDWEKQLNLYALLIRNNNLPVVRLQICVILRDWQKSKTKFDKSYPQSPIVLINMPLWKEITQNLFLEELIENHENAKLVEDADLPLCSSEEMWESPTTYAVFKEGNKRASKVEDTFELAENWAKNNLAKYNWIIEQRKGERKRCQDYCPVAQFCSQWKEYNECV